MTPSEAPPLAVITGGEGDLAGKIAIALREIGYQVLTPGRSELEVTDAAGVKDYFSALDSLDLLINNAGVAGDGLFLRQSADEWSSIVDTNLKGAFLCSQAAAAKMIRRREGHILQIGSYAARHPAIGQSAYAAAKAGLEGLTRSLAAELGPRNIRVNAVLPGFLETRMTAPLSDATKEAALARHRLGRFNTVEEAARFIAELSTFQHISGQVFQLDSRP